MKLKELFLVPISTKKTEIGIYEETIVIENQNDLRIYQTVFRGTPQELQLYVAKNEYILDYEIDGIIIKHPNVLRFRISKSNTKIIAQRA